VSPRSARSLELNLRLLVVSESLSARLSAGATTRALARGLEQGGLPAPDLLALPNARPAGEELAEFLDDERFPERLDASRALVIVAARLPEHALQASPAFELATRARQRGVPAYAVGAESTLDSFEARILDLQLVLQAASPQALARAGRTLAAEVRAGIR
jgi:glycerate kinase